MFNKHILTIIVSVLSTVTIVLSLQAQDLDSYPIKPFKIEGRRWVYPKPLPPLSTTDDILNLKIPFVETTYDMGHYFLFRLIGGICINFEFTTQEFTPEKAHFKQSETYSLISKSLSMQEKNLPRKTVQEIANICFEKWGYQYKLGNISMTIYPQKKSFLEKIRVPSIHMDNFSFNKIDHNEIISQLMKENGMKYLPNGIGVVSGAFENTDTTFEKLESAKSNEFTFRFAGGNMLEYLISACEACMNEHPNYFVSFKFEPNQKSFRKRMNSKLSSLINLRFDR